jgi:hypothetical protein
MRWWWLLTALLSIVDAAHYRMATLSWSRLPSDPLTILYESNMAFQYSGAEISGGTTVTSAGDFPINWGDMSSTSPVTAKLLEFSGKTTNDYMLVRQSAHELAGITHHYPAGFTTVVYKPGWSSCCRNGALLDGNGANVAWRVLAGVDFTFSLNITSSPRMNGLAEVTFHRHLVNTYIIPVQADYLYNLTLTPLADPFGSGLAELAPAGMVLLNRTITWTPGVVGEYAVSFRASHWLEPNVFTTYDFTIHVIDPLVAASLPPLPPQILSTSGAVFTDGYNFGIGPGETLTITIRATAVHPLARAYLIHNALPLNATITPCAEGTSATQAPHSLIYNCTRTFNWTVPDASKNYDIIFASQDNNTLFNMHSRSQPMSFQIIMIQPAPVITSVLPSVVHIDGLVNITIIGYNFVVSQTMSTTVTLSTVGYCEEIWVIDNNTLICEVPPGPEGLVVSVTVDYNNRTSYQQSNYTYDIPPPFLYSIQPTHAPTGVVTNVTVTGINFGQGVSNTGQLLILGNQAILPVILCSTDGTQCIFSVGGPGAGGYGIPVQLQIQAGPTITPTNASVLFSWDPPHIVVMSPNTNDVTGQTVVLTGYNFGSNSSGGSVYVNGILASPSVGAYSWNDTYVVFVIPAAVTPGNGTAFVYVSQSGQQSNTLVFDLMVFPPAVTSLIPSNVPTVGNANITITGRAFVFPCTVNLGSGQCVDLYQLSITTIICVAPPGQGASISLTVVSPYGFSSIPTSYSYDPPLISVIHPVHGPTAGPTNVTVVGVNFGQSGQTLALVGQQTGLAAAVCDVISDSQCIFPIGNGAGGTDIPVTLSVGGQTSPTNVSIVYSWDAPHLNAISPDDDDIVNEAVVLSGYNFGSNGAGGSVYVNGILVDPLSSGYSWTDASITFHIPAAVTPGNGTGYIYVIQSGQTSNTLTFDLLVYPPAVLSLSPSLFPTVGGLNMTITGRVFVAGSTSVVLGQTGACTTLYVISMSTMVCVVPAGQGANISVLVTTYGLNSSASPAAYSYVPPLIYHINPVNGPTDGLTVVTVTGIDFGQSGQTFVLAGQGAVGPDSCNPEGTLCTFDVGTGAGGANIDATLEVAGQSSPLNDSIVFSWDPPHLTSISPSNGDIDGESVSLTGTNFGFSSDGGSVYVNGILVDPLSVGYSWDGIGVVFDIPIEVTPGNGTGYVYVVQSGQRSNTLTFNLLVYPPAVLTVIPPNAPTVGGTNVTIIGRVFIDHVTTVMLGTNGHCEQLYVLNMSAMACTVPPGQGTDISILVTTYGLNSSASPASYSYDAPVVYSVDPDLAATAGGTNLTAIGINFGQSGQQLLLLEQQLMNALVCNPEETECIFQLGPGAGGFEIPLVFKVGGQSSAFVPDAVLTWDAPHIVSINPNMDVLLGEAVTIHGTNFGSSVVGSSIFIDGLPVNTSSPAYVWMDTFAVFDIPNGVTIGDGMATVYAVQSGQTSNMLSFDLHVFPPTITSLSPANVPTVGGVNITIAGSYFATAATTVLLGEGACTQQYVLSATRMVCVTPPGQGAPISLIVTKYGLNSSVFFYSYDPPLIYSVSPSLLPTAGVSTITVTGVNFGQSGQMLALLGQVVVDAIGCNGLDTICTFSVGPGMGGFDIPVIMIVDNQTSPFNASIEISWEVPHLISITPNADVLLGQAVIVFGSNFGTDVEGGSVYVNGVRANSSSPDYDWTDTFVVFDIPLGLTIGNGTAFVYITQSGQTSNTLSFTLHVYPPDITSLALNDAPTVGGTNATITGSIFTTETTVVLSEGACEHLYLLSNTTLVCTIPPGQGTSISLMVVAYGLNSSEYLYSYDPPVVFSVYPTVAPTAGVTNVTVTGANFGQSGQFVTTIGHLGSVLAITCNDLDTVCIFAVGPGPGGANIPVILGVGGQFSPLNDSIVFSWQAPHLTSIVPATGVLLGEIVTVHGVNFGSRVSTSSIYIDGVAVNTSVSDYYNWTDTAASFVVPVNHTFENGTATVYVVQSGQQSNTLVFTLFIPPPVSSSAIPSSSGVSSTAQLSSSTGGISSTGSLSSSSGTNSASGTGSVSASSGASVSQSSSPSSSSSTGCQGSGCTTSTSSSSGASLPSSSTAVSSSAQTSGTQSSSGPSVISSSGPSTSQSSGQSFSNTGQSSGVGSSTVSSLASSAVSSSGNNQESSSTSVVSVSSQTSASTVPGTSVPRPSSSSSSSTAAEPGMNLIVTSSFDARNPGFIVAMVLTGLVVALVVWLVIISTAPAVTASAGAIPTYVEMAELDAY